MPWWRKEPAVPTVELFEVHATGAALSWTDDRSRGVAIEMFVELVRRLENQDHVERLRLSGLIGTPIDVADVATFVRAAPDLFMQMHQAYRFEFRLNEDARPYTAGHLDQDVPGMWFDTPAGPEPFWSALVAVLRDFAARDPGVCVSAGAWDIGAGPADA